jgi:hypothetical protein
MLGYAPSRGFTPGLLAGALDLDALGHPFRRPARDPHLQYAGLEAGAYLSLLDVVGQNDAPPEGAVAPLPDVVAGVFPRLLCPSLAAYGQYPLVERYLHVLALDAGELRPNEQVPVLVQHVERGTAPYYPIHPGT